MDNTSDNRAEFSFKPKAATVEQKDEAPTKSPVEREEPQPAVVEAKKDDFNEPYLDERKITISLVRNYSLYRQANDKVLPKRKDYIGSSI